MLSSIFKCLFKVYFGEVTLRECWQGGRAAGALPEGEAISPPPRLEPVGQSLPDPGEAPSSENLAPGAAWRLLGNVSFLYVNKSFLECARITAGCC